MISTSTISSFSLLASQTSSVLRSAAFACTFFSTMSFISSSSAASSSAAPTTPAFLSAKIMTKQLNQPLFDPAFVVHMASKPIIQHQDSSLPSLADSIVSSEDFTGKSLFQTLVRTFVRWSLTTVCKDKCNCMLFQKNDSSQHYLISFFFRRLKDKVLPRIALGLSVIVELSFKNWKIPARVFEHALPWDAMPWNWMCFC
jgi:hypothetical protein